MKLVEGIAELFHRVFYLKDRKVAVMDHVWALVGVGAWVLLSPYGHSPAVDSSGGLPLIFSVVVAPAYEPEMLWEQES